MELGLFKLENVLSTPTRFCFIDLREGQPADDPQLQPLLRRATRIPEAEVEGYLRSQHIAVDSPVLLVCEDGDRSSQLARQLEAKAFTNIYVVAGGVAGLLSEL